MKILHNGKKYVLSTPMLEFTFPGEYVIDYKRDGQVVSGVVMKKG